MYIRLKKYYSLFIIISVWFVMISSYYIHSTTPFPSTYQVNAFAPWSAYKEFWSPVKNSAMPDIIDQIYPWKHFTIEVIKNAMVPLWNPYSFAGTPHLANYQSAVLSPFNILFIIFSFLWGEKGFIEAWTIFILLQPLLAGSFMWLYIRQIRVGSVGSIISAISFMYCGFMTSWLGYGTLGYAILFLPLSLYAIEKYYEKKDTIHLVLLSCTLPLSFFSGHFQISIYFFLVVVIYALYKATMIRSGTLSRNVFLFIIFGLLLCMPQIIPSIELYQESIRSNLFQKIEAIPFSYLLTFFVPDFFGNPVTRNNWFGHYGEWNGYIGLIPCLLALYTILRKKTKLVLFFLLIAFISLLLALDTPLLNLLIWLHLPVLSTSAASRVIVIFSFSFAVLAGIGTQVLLDDIRKLQTHNVIYLLLFFLCFFITLWLAIYCNLFLPTENIKVVKSNLLLPSLIFLGFFISILLRVVIKQKLPETLLAGIMVFLVIFDMLRFTTKWQPNDPKDKVFPDISVTKFMTHRLSGYERALGNYGSQMSVYYGIPSVEGYDALYSQRYGEFIKAIEYGIVEPSPRSGVKIAQNGKYISKVINLLGIKYIIHKASDKKAVWTFPYWKYPEGQFKLIFSDNNYTIFQNTYVYPRVLLADSYTVVKNKQAIIDTMFSKNYNLKKKVVLEEDISLPYDVQPSLHTEKILSYTPNKITVQVNTDKTRLLLLTDAFYSGWKAYVDRKETKIYRADYTFRSVLVPKGKHIVTFTYEPASFTVGVMVFMLGVSMICWKCFGKKKL